MTVIGPVTVQGASQPLGARVLGVPPPLYYGAAFTAGMLLRATSVSLPLGARPETVVIAIVLLIAGTALALAGAIAVLRNRTTMVPHHAVSVLVTTGAYRVTRNPMYTGLAIGYLGGALLTGSWWPVATLPFALLTIRRLVIDPEERYLASTFGPTYSDYQGRVRRWL